KLPAGHAPAFQPKADARPRQGARPASGMERSRVLALVDRMLARGAGAAAEPLLEALDEARTTRGGDVYLRRAALALGRGDASAARTALQRAQAFDTHGGYEFLNLLLTAEEGRLEDLRAAALSLAATGFRASPIVAAQL